MVTCASDFSIKVNSTLYIQLVMSVIFTLKSRTPTLSIDFPNPIQLNPNYQYGLALIGFHSYNTIPNIEFGTPFYYFDTKEKKDRFITIPEGSYEISDIQNYIRKKLVFRSNQVLKSEVEEEEIFYLKPNNNTLKCEIFHRDFNINFKYGNRLGNLLGFSERVLEAGKVHVSDLPVNIVKVRTIHIDSNITVGAYYNNKPTHTLYEFPISVDPGFAIDEIPKNLIYLPVVCNEINNITLSVLDQDFNLINFRGEEIIIRLELRKNGPSDWGI